MSVNAERIGDFSWHLHEPWTMVIIQVALALAILYKNSSRGYSCFCFYCASLQGKLMESKDTRIMKATSEVLRNMRILKTSGLGNEVLIYNSGVEDVEDGWLRKFLYTSTGSTFVFWLGTNFCICFHIWFGVRNKL
ncbi:ATP-binding cassette [Lithospermum erythrorhizon]|uniref:ATP-binding cassette n=1 Tax=Lithospermum erythrorhizon TaxID=34254 RepID=A0AAV3P7A6_LITER